MDQDGTNGAQRGGKQSEGKGPEGDERVGAVGVHAANVVDTAALRSMVRAKACLIAPIRYQMQLESRPRIEKDNIRRSALKGTQHLVVELAEAGNYPMK